MNMTEKTSKDYHDEAFVICHDAAEKMQAAGMETNGPEQELINLESDAYWAEADAMAASRMASNEEHFVVARVEVKVANDWNRGTEAMFKLAEMHKMAAEG